MISQIRAGYGRSVLQPHLPVVIGRDISGEVAAVGNSVKAFKVGQEVFGALHPTALRGTYTDYGILSEEELTEKPSSVSHVVSGKISICPLHLFYLIFFFSVESFQLFFCLHLVGGECYSFCCVDCLACFEE